VDPAPETFDLPRRDTGLPHTWSDSPPGSVMR